MRNEKLREVFVGLGFTNVRTVISSGNVLFDSPSSAVKTLERQVEEELPKRLGFTSTTIIRSRKQLQDLVDADPFGGMEHDRKTYLNLTFLKHKARSKLSVPFQPEDRDYTIIGMDDRTVYSIIDTTNAKTPDLMTWLEKQFGKEITTRTYATVQKILKKMNDS